MKKQYNVAQANVSTQPFKLRQTGLRAHDLRNFHVSLRQWKLLHAVNDYGGYAAAADSLHMSRSAVSYGIKNLQDQLGVVLFEVQGRKAILTEAGKILLAQSRKLMSDALAIEDLAGQLNDGAEKTIELIIDTGFPSHIVLETIARFAKEQPEVRIDLRETRLDPIQPVTDGGHSPILISRHAGAGYARELLLHIDHVLIAHCEHPLCALQRELTLEDLARFTVAFFPKNINYSALPLMASTAKSAWTFDTADSAVKALLQGLCYCFAPRYSVHRWIEEGVLKVLSLQGCNDYASVNYYLLDQEYYVKVPWRERFLTHLREVIREQWQDLGLAMPEHATKPVFTLQVSLDATASNAGSQHATRLSKHPNFAAPASNLGYPQGELQSHTFHSTPE